jgi:solute carrier family 35 (GDP-fucose transporter), member C1
MLMSKRVYSGRASSIGVILGGSIYYTWVKHVESQPRNASGDGSTAKYEQLQMEEAEAGQHKNTSSKPE